MVILKMATTAMKYGPNAALEVKDLNGIKFKDDVVYPKMFLFSPFREELFNLKPFFTAVCDWIHNDGIPEDPLAHLSPFLPEIVELRKGYTSLIKAFHRATNNSEVIFELEATVERMVDSLQMFYTQCCDTAAKAEECCEACNEAIMLMGRVVAALQKNIGLHSHKKEEPSIASPDFRDREDCKRFLREVYAFLREHYASKLHTETQAINYILTEAKKDDAYFELCKTAREIKAAFNWERGTFTTYCKSAAPKPKGLKIAAKTRAKKRLVLRDLKRK